MIAALKSLCACGAMTSTRFTTTADRVFACQGVPVTLTRMRPVADVALATDRPRRTIRNWAQDGLIPSIHRNGRLLVDLVAAAQRSEQTGRRNRAHAA